MTEHFLRGNLTKPEIIRSLVAQLQSSTFDVDTEEPVFIHEARGLKDEIVLKCTDGTNITLALTDISVG